MASETDRIGELDATTSLVEPLETWRSPAYLVAGVMFALAAVIMLVGIWTGAEQQSMVLGEAFIAAGWAGALLGLLGMYAEFAGQRRWLVRAGGLFAVVGLGTFVWLVGASGYAFVAGLGITEIPIHPVVFVVGTLFGSFLAFGCFSVISFRSDRQSSRLGVVLLVPALIYFTNFFILPVMLGTGPNPPEVIFVVTGLLTLAMGAIVYVLRTEDGPNNTSGSDPTPE
jgi:hypothetical protein